MTNKVNLDNLHFHVVRQLGEPNKARLPDGTLVRRAEQVYIREMNGLVKCMHYDNHFIYLTPNKKNTWFAACTCGGPAVIMGSNAYQQWSSPKGAMLVCYVHMTNGKHADGST